MGRRRKRGERNDELVLILVTVSKVVDNPRWCAPESMFTDSFPLSSPSPYPLPSILYLSFFLTSLSVIKKTPYDEKSDVYSFAIILWEIITGEQPFAEFDIKWTHVLEDKIIHEGLRPTIPSTCDPTYATLMKRCWVCSFHTHQEKKEGRRERLKGWFIYLLIYVLSEWFTSYSSLFFSSGSRPRGYHASCLVTTIVY